MDGHCPIPDKPNKEQACTAFCQQRLRIYYGPEQTFEGAMRCAAGQECELKIGDSVSTTTGYEISGGVDFGFEVPGKSIEAAFNVGATMQWSQTVSHLVENVWKRTISENTDHRSGKFVFVPLMFQACGILSSTPEEDNIDPCIMPSLHCTVEQANYVCVKEKSKEKTDYCQSPAPVKTSDGKIDGWIIFVALCQESACGEGQDAAYYAPGVSRDAGFKDVAKPETAREQSIRQDQA